MPLFSIQVINLYQNQQKNIKTESQIKIVKLSELGFYLVETKQDQDSTNAFDKYCFVNEIYQ